ncbi:protease complex subunit PrcB family protein [Polycladomyces subterraneus]|uniref:Protease complex subunit PrcB family protein n=1 Tax=Polycladomyces subterraneus TaxID=1016997 RepID=A0ABT8IR59_9BACL|nr:protease complex subunit PrcB family protein [Polycladomyces subterraneus]MDN4595286.1 protease complex subunit PrcB family protein [Polycladomyces subterraneus]
MNNPWKVIVMLSLVLMMGITGCGGGMSRDHGTPEGKTPHDDADIPFHQESPQQLPVEVKKRWEEMQATGEPTGVAVHVDKRTYVIAALGVRPTGGYRLKIQRIHRHGQMVVVYAEEQVPPPGSLVTQVISYPATVVSIPLQKDVTFQFRIKTARPPAQT